MTDLMRVVSFIPLVFSALLPVINPIGSAMIFLGLVSEADHAARSALARQIAINTVLFLFVVLFAGTYVLRFFGISLPVVQVAGGLVLAAMGWSLLNSPSSSATPDEVRVGSASSDDRGFYPLTFPLTAGPACVVVTLIIGAHASRGTVTQIVLAHVGAMIGIVLIGAVVYVTYANADRIAARLSPSATQGILRIISFILFCIGGEIVWGGVQTLVASLR